jgi:hypothetical protein
VAEWGAVSSLVSTGRHGEAGLKVFDVVGAKVRIFEICRQEIRVQ